MAGVRRFEDLDAHKLAVQLRRKVIRLSSRAPMKNDLEFVRQIRNSVRGAPRNIAEGFSRFIPAENLRFLSYAKASLDETKNHLDDAHESDYLSDDDHAELLTLTRRTLAAVSRLMRYLQSPAAKRAYERARGAPASPTPRTEP